MARYLTKQDLLNGSADAGILEKFANDALGQPNLNRVGNDVKNLQTLRVEALEAASAVANIKTYITKAAMLADTSRPVPSTGRVTNDPVVENNGDYVWNGSVWVWSQIQPASVLTTNALGAEVGMLDDRTSIQERISGGTSRIAIDDWLFADVDQLSGKVLFGLRRGGRIQISGDLAVGGVTSGMGVGFASPTVGDVLEGIAGENGRAVSYWSGTGERYQMLPGGQFGKVYDPTWFKALEDRVDAAVGGSGFKRPALQTLIHRCFNTLQDVNAVIVGDSIAWGVGASSAGPTTPRDQRLSDVRANLTCRSWVNLLREYLGRRYMNVPVDAMPIEEVAQGAPAGGAGYYSEAQSHSFAESPYVLFRTAEGHLMVPARVATLAPALVPFGVVIPAGGALEFEMLAREFSLFFQKIGDASERKFGVYVDGELLTEQVFSAGVTSWGNSVECVLPRYKFCAVRIVNTSAVSLCLEGLRRTKVIRVVNQGISGTTAISWSPQAPASRQLLVDGMPLSVSDVIVALGTNDRLGMATPANSTRFEDGVGQIVQWLKSNRPKADLLLLGAYATLDDDAEKAFSQRDVTRSLFNVASRFNISAFSPYQQMRDAMDDGQALFSPGEKVHPNDAGHKAVFSAIKNAAETSNSR